jgi:general secretion pathway protein K
MQQFNFRARRNSSAGFIVVAALWIVAALATLAMTHATYVRATAFALADYDLRLQGQELARAGVELAVYRLTENPQARPSQGKFGFRLGKAGVAVDFRSENSRVDLNFAPKQLLVGLFTVLGAEREDAEGHADRIVAWRTPATSQAADNEEMLYRSAGMNYGPRHGPFQHVNELGLVAGLPPDLVDRALPYLTVYSGQPEINVSDAAPEVLAALPGVTPGRIGSLLAQREGASQDVLNSRLGVAAQYVTMRRCRRPQASETPQRAGRSKARASTEASPMNNRIIDLSGPAKSGVSDFAPLIGVSKSAADFG